jgi:trimethylamine--corrinoid protein Co-methyltransferase
MINFATLLTPDEVSQTHQASLEILEHVGLLVRNEKARKIFSTHGCIVDEQTQIVKFPSKIVEQFRCLCPAKFTFHGRNPQYDRTIPDDSPLIVTASSAPNLIDPVTGEERRSTSDDIARIAHLINELPGYDVFSISTLAQDAPAGQFTLSRLYPALKNCMKPVRSTATDINDALKVLELGYLVCGGEKVYRERPIITHHFCPVVSPLTMDFASTELTIFFAEQGLPVYPSIVPNGGLTSPMTMSGTLVQGNAEFLAIATLMQMAKPGTPLIYSTLPTIADMRTGAYASGGVECGMLHMAFAQMAHYYNVPCGGYIGLTNSKINDGQMGFETGISSTAALLAGADMLNMGGLLDALKAFDFAKAVIDDEIALMLKRIKRGMEFSQDNMALDIIAEIGPGGTFMTHRHTVKWMKTSALMTKIADRDPREVWKNKGANDTHARALTRARQILSKPNEFAFTKEIEDQIRKRFPDLVAGDLKNSHGLVN